MEGPPWPSSLWSSSPTVSRLKADLVEVDWEATGLTYIAVEAVWHARVARGPLRRLVTPTVAVVAQHTSHPTPITPKSTARMIRIRHLWPSDPKTPRRGYWLGAGGIGDSFILLSPGFCGVC